MESPLDVQVALHPTAVIKIVAMPKRNLRVTKWVGTIPVVGVCTYCDRLFNVPVTALKRVGDAQESLRLQFAEFTRLAFGSRPDRPSHSPKVAEIWVHGKTRPSRNNGRDSPGWNYLPRAR